MAILEIGPNRECIPSFGSLGQRFTTSPEARRRPPEAILRGKQDDLNFLAIILEILVRSLPGVPNERLHHADAVSSQKV